MNYELRVLREGVVETLSVEAQSADEARQLGLERRLEVLSVRGAETAWRQPQRFDLSLFAQELAELLDAGLSVVEAVDTLAHQQGHSGHNDVAKVYQDLVRSLRQGLTFSAALEHMPQRFPALFVGLIRAAERTSDLHGALQRYLEYSGRLDALRNKIVSALIYPSILLVVGGGVVVFLLSFVVPRFASVYRGGGRELPLLSSLLLDWGAFASRNAQPLVIGALMLLALIALLALRAHRRGTLERAAALLPGVERRIHLFRLSRLYLTVGTLLNGGMPLVQALGLAQGVVGGKHRALLDATIDALKRGGAIGDSLERHQLTTAVSLRLLRAGEGTGRIGDLFIRAGRYHDNELGRWVDRFSRLFEPILMAAIGIVIGGIVILLYMPIFDLAGSFR
ncbi:type II secretion system F family protein [Paucibacter sp. O1-1]|nr:type II secretion system F family protein [Paucibacter sp. O1-1]MDA3831102.1 type II secretion system F family protein [Paucibacter sp. O1-1]